MPWRPDTYEIDFVDRDGFRAALDALEKAAGAQRLRIYVQRMSNPQYHDSKGDDIKKLKGKEAEQVGLHELRLRFRPEYRVYFGYRGNSLILAGVGTKHTQTKDIRDASKALRQWDQVRRERRGDHPRGDHQRRCPRGHRS